MKTKLFAVLFFALPAVALAKAGVMVFPNNPGFSTAFSPIPNKPAFAKAFSPIPNKPAFAKATAGKGNDPIDIKVVVSQKRIWLVADEMPMKCLKTKITNSEGKIVLEKCFTSKCADWFLNIEALPKGDYTLHLGSEYTEKFKK